MPIVLKDRGKKIHAFVSDLPDQPAQEIGDPLNLRVKHTALECVPIGEIKPNRRNAKKHPERQIALIAHSIIQFGFTHPLIVEENNELIAGHARLRAARRLDLSHVPVIRFSNLTPSEKRALAIADNKLAELGQWDLDLLQEELAALFDPETELTFDPYIMGFETSDIDQILQAEPVSGRADPADQIEQPDPAVAATTVAGDHWECGSHKLQCGSATDLSDYQALMGAECADLAFADGPCSVPKEGHVTRRADVRPMEAGEMASDDFAAFNRTFCTNVLAYLAAGAVVYLGTEWWHLRELQAAADSVFGVLKNLIVWVKTNAEIGSFYRSQHEMILVYVAPGGRPTNQLGTTRKGRYRTDVWKYDGFDAAGRDETVAMHHRVKPVALVADALMDCSKRGGIVLDPFGRSGTTMIAAERTGRRARLLEIDPLHCDLIIQRWQKFSGKTARLAETNETFAEVKARRATKPPTRGT